MARADRKKVVLSVDRVSKSFRLPTEQSSGIKQAFVNWSKGVKGYKEQSVLRDISFTVEEGDFFGIVGRNGSGKSTLLKLISQIYEPDSGRISVEGKLVPFIELGVGFNPELTGRENIYLNGALLGFSHQEVSVMYEDIVEFAELEEFMDQKLKNYSSGMQVRLAFSIAIRSEGSILILDEVLAVGDEAFQRKCSNYFKEIKKQKDKTVILVTHSMGDIRKYCNKAILIKDGEIVTSGSPVDVANRYALENIEQQQGQPSEAGDGEDIGGGFTQSTVSDFRAEVVGLKQINQDQSVRVKFSFVSNENQDIYIHTDLYDLGRGAAVRVQKSQVKRVKPGAKYSETIEYSAPEINDTNFIIYATLRDKNKNTLASIAESSCPQFILRRSDYLGIDEDEKYPILYAKPIDPRSSPEQTIR